MKITTCPHAATTSCNLVDLFNGHFEVKVDGGYQNAASMPYMATDQTPVRTDGAIFVENLQRPMQ
jgi:hypothetical protein